MYKNRHDRILHDKNTKEMRIGVITLGPEENYGGILQAYALQKVLKDMGHDAAVIDKDRYLHWSFFKKSRVYTKRFLKKMFIDKNTIVRLDKKNNEELEILRTNIYPFIQKNIKRRETDRRYSNINKDEFDAFVVGSDQVWRPRYFGKTIIDRAYLSFAKGWNVKRISYAASFGTDEWLYNRRETKSCGKLLRRFDAVSVRESSAVELCKRHFGVEAQHLLDPTMLLDTSDYIKLFEEAGTPPSDGTLMCYFLDSNPDKENIISHIANKFGLKAFTTNSMFDNHDLPLEQRIQPPLENWLRAFYDAEFVITDSFHACVFSILFRKPFIVYGNKTRGMTRFSSLLKIFGLENRLITNNQEVEAAIATPIDWDRVNSIKKEWQEKSFKFLKDNL